MKLLFRIFLSLSWLLLGFNSGAQGHVLEDCVMYAPARNVLHAAYVVPPFKVCDDLLTPAYAPNISGHEHERIYAEEKDEESSNAPTVKKKKSHSGNSYFTFFYAENLRHLPYYTKDELPVSRHLCFLSISRPIVFRSILI